MAVRQQIAAKNAAKHHKGTDHDKHGDSRPGHDVLDRLIDRSTLKLRLKSDNALEQLTRSDFYLRSDVLRHITNENGPEIRAVLPTHM
ncbi:hypothetical protein GCM10011408_14160 [Dyella caseinilytica]|nr:hypothetical protein GCM10011408_14160 [Dyella caseinilytica]